MDAYMRENKLETVEPQLPPVAPPRSKKKNSPASGDNKKSNEKA